MLANKLLVLLLVAANAPKVMPRRSLDNSVLQQIKDKVDMMDVKKTSIVSEIQSISEKLATLQYQVLKQAGTIQTLRDSQKVSNQLRVNPKSFFRTMGRTFHFNETAIVQWYAAKEYCQKRGMQLPVLKTFDELQNVTIEIEKRRTVSDGYYYWVDASDIGREPAGLFEWSDGTPVDTSLWYPGNPSQFYYGKETCVLVYTVQAKLRDYGCTSQRRVLCEVPADLTVCA